MYEINIYLTVDTIRTQITILKATILHTYSVYIWSRMTCIIHTQVKVSLMVIDHKVVQSLT